MLPLRFMRLAKTFTFTGLLLTAFAADAQDGPFFGNHANGKWMIGAKVANIDPQEPEAIDSRGVGIILGYQFDREVFGRGSTSFEIEYIAGDDEDVTLLNGVENFTPIDQSLIIGTYEATIINAFFNYRSAGDLYFKFKAGLSYVDLDFDFNFQGVDFIDRSSEDTSLAAGIGLGYRFGDAGLIEFDIYKDSGNADTGVASLNAVLTF